MKRRYISIKTKLASTLLAMGHVPYDEAKQMTEDQIISLFHFDHNVLHRDGGADVYWNLTPMLISAHRIKTGSDIKALAKTRRIRAWGTKSKYKWPSRKIPARRA